VEQKLTKNQAVSARNYMFFTYAGRVQTLTDFQFEDKVSCNKFRVTANENIIKQQYQKYV
jgi:hypothetical protein